MPSFATRPSQPRRRRSLVALAIGALLLLGGVLLGGATACAASQSSSAAPSALPAGTHIGAIELLVNDLDTVTAYYRDAVGLVTLGETSDTVALGFDTPLIRLVKTDASPDDPAQAGLYHSAILFPDEAALANTLARISATAPGSFVGASDHRVSQAFYFTDPEGNGLELYVDRPAEEWVWSGGKVEMGSSFIDPNAFIREHSGESLRKGAVTMGHAHVRVGNLDEARRFYVDGLGFAETSAGNGAVFFGANGYHHHIGANTWTSAGAGARPTLAGLGSLTIHVPDTETLDAVNSRLAAAGFTVDRDGDVLLTTDPWGSAVSVRVFESAQR